MEASNFKRALVFEEDYFSLGDAHMVIIPAGIMIRESMITPSCVVIVPPYR